MLETSPIKRLLKNIELIKDSGTYIESNTKKIEEKQMNMMAKRTDTPLQKRDTLQAQRIRYTSSSNEKNPIELQGLIITRHQDEMINKHHELHDTIKNIRKQSGI